MNIDDFLRHPLMPFFCQVAREYDRSVEKHGDWNHLSDDEQCNKIRDEYFEVRNAMMEGNINGAHGEKVELSHLANVCAKRYIQLTKGEGV